MRKHERRYTLRGTAQPGDPVGFNDDGSVETMNDKPKYKNDTIPPLFTRDELKHAQYWRLDEDGTITPVIDTGALIAYLERIEAKLDQLLAERDDD